MSLSRRSLVIGAGSAALVAGGAAATLALTSAPTTARQPWSATAQSDGDPRIGVFCKAILAPNPHNRQPWRIRLVGRDAAVISCDLDRRLPETDPFDRQIAIGFGSFLEIARIAAAERGYALDVALFPEGEPQPRLDKRPVAMVTFRADSGVEKSGLADAIGKRRTVKQPFDAARAVAEDARSALLAAAAAGQASSGLSSDPALVRDLRDLTWQAWTIEAETPRTYRESVDLMRIGRAEIEANPDGIALGGPMIELLAMTGQITRARLADTSSSAFKSGMDRYRAMLAGVASYAWVATAGNSRADQIAAGAAYVRLNLRATQLGLSVHPVSQALQEFPEMAGMLAAVRARIGVKPGDTLQMLARIGYGPDTPPAPRWAIEHKLETA